METDYEQMIKKMGMTWGEIEKIVMDRGKWRVLIWSLPYVVLGIKRIST